MADTLRYKILLEVKKGPRLSDQRLLKFYTLAVTLPPPDPKAGDDVNDQGREQVRKLFDQIAERHQASIRVPAGQDGIDDAFREAAGGNVHLDVEIQLMVFQGNPNGYDRFVRAVHLSGVVVEQWIPLNNGYNVARVRAMEGASTAE